MLLWKETREQLRGMTENTRMELVNASTGQYDHNVAIVKLWKLGFHGRVWVAINICKQSPSQYGSGMLVVIAWIDTM